MRRVPQPSPISLAVVASVVIVLVAVFGAGTVAGSYYLSLRAISQQAAQQDQLRTREATFQIRQAVPTCRAINAMDQASHIPAADFPSPPHNIYDRRLSAAIHNVNATSHCPLILRDVARHVPYTEILRQIQGDSASANRNAGPQG